MGRDAAAFALWLCDVQIRLILLTVQPGTIPRVKSLCMRFYEL